MSKLAHLLYHALLALLVAPSVRAQPAEVPPVTPAAFSFDEFRNLRWLEGTWRGSSGGGPPFYERYRLEDDSTLAMTYYADSTLAEATGTASVSFRAGRIHHESGAARWVVTGLDEAGLHFAPVARATNRFTWTYHSPSEWTATLSQPTGRTVAYHLERVDDPAAPAGPEAQR